MTIAELKVRNYWVTWMRVERDGQAVYYISALNHDTAEEDYQAHTTCYGAAEETFGLMCRRLTEV